MTSPGSDGSTRRRTARAALACGVCLVAAARLVAGQEADATVYVRGDTDRTTVVTPRLHVAAPVRDDTKLGVVYSVDVWTSASIDIRTSASKVITDPSDAPITEQRDEIDVSVEHAVDDTRITGGYRYSTEPDYQSHGGVLGFELDLADRSETLGATLMANFDDVGRVGDPDFSRRARQLAVRTSFTQIFDRDTLAQLIYEIGHAQGYLASPYRFVGIGGGDASCRNDPDAAVPVLYCVPESTPDSRLRHALAVRGRRALGSAFSVGAGYRFYLDDWELRSHTAEADVGWLPVADLTLKLRYRFYWQSAAAHYRARYPEFLPDRFYTRDKELSPLHAHGVALDLGRAWDIDATGSSLRAQLSAGPTLYEYRDFPGLDQITAIEVTLGVVLER